MENWMEGLPDDLLGNEVLQGIQSTEDLARLHLKLIDAQKPWKETLSPEFDTEENREALKDFDSVEDLAKGMVNLRTKVPVVPESPDDYTFPDPEQEGVELSDEAMSYFRPILHEAHATQEQADILTKGFNNFIFKQVEAQAAADEKAAEDAVNELKTTWGPDKYESNKNALNKALVTVAKSAGMGEEDIKILSDHYAHDSRLARILFAVSQVISEDPFDTGGSPKGKKEDLTGEEFMKEVFKKGDKGE